MNPNTHLHKPKLSPVDTVADRGQGGDSQEEEEEEPQDAQRDVTVAEPAVRDVKRICLVVKCLWWEQ